MKGYWKKKRKATLWKSRIVSNIFLFYYSGLVLCFEQIGSNNQINVK